MKTIIIPLKINTRLVYLTLLLPRLKISATEKNCLCLYIFLLLIRDCEFRWFIINHAGNRNITKAISVSER